MSVSRKGPSLKAYAKQLRTLPRTVAIKIAERGAAKISAAAEASFDGGRTAHDEPRPLGSRGNQVDLVVSGRLRSMALRYRHDGGTRIRASVSGGRYMGVMIGRFGVLPHGSRLPARWHQLLGQEAHDAAEEEAAP